MQPCIASYAVVLKNTKGNNCGKARLSVAGIVCHIRSGGPSMAIFVARETTCRMTSPYGKYECNIPLLLVLHIPQHLVSRSQTAIFLARLPNINIHNYKFMWLYTNTNILIEITMRNSKVNSHLSHYYDARHSGNRHTRLILHKIKRILYYINKTTHVSIVV